MFARLARFIALITLLPLAVLAAPAATPITAIPKVTVAGQAVGTNTAGLTLNTCPKYIVIEAPGLGDKGGGWTGPTTAGILNGLSGAPADAGPNSNGQQLITQAAQGGLEIVRVVAQRTAQCPNVKFVLFGYSYGTIELRPSRAYTLNRAALALNNPALLRTNIAAVLFYGKCVKFYIINGFLPRLSWSDLVCFWHADQEGNRGTAKSGTSVCGRENGMGTPLTYQGITADFCLVNDYLCTGTPYCGRGSKNCNNSHWNYKNSQWQSQAVSFAIQQLKASNNFGL